ncbi:MAG TPA: hypothetical protein PKH07_17025, partial [bacterium]|nr:hypothetical protein [bacterium]
MTLRGNKMTKADYCQQQIVRILRDTLVILAISVALGCGKSGSQATGGHSTPGASTAHASGQINNESDPIPSNLPSVRVAVVEG